MEERRLGPVVGLGTWQTFDADGTLARAVVDSARAAGTTVFDSSPMYGEAERVLGEALGARRDEAFVATKVWTPEAAEGERQAARALAWYGGRVDLYQVHNLVNTRAHLAMLDRLRGEERVRYIGATHYSASAFGELARVMRSGRLDAIQIPYNPLQREVEDEILPTARELGIAFVAYSPLGRGFLAGGAPTEADDRRNLHPRFQEEAVRANARRRRVIEDAAERLHLTPAQVSLAWVLSKDVVPIPGTRHVRHLEDNWAANGVALDSETIADLEAAFPRGATVGARYPAEQMKLVPPARAYA